MLRNAAVGAVTLLGFGAPYPSCANGTNPFNLTQATGYAKTVYDRPQKATLKTESKIFHRTADEKDSDSPSRFRVISYKCPDENGNEIELIKKNPEKELVRAIGVFQNSKIVRISLRHAYPGEPYTVVFSGLPNTCNEDGCIKALNNTLRQFDELKTKICDNVDVSWRSRFDAFVVSNQSILK